MSILIAGLPILAVIVVANLVEARGSQGVNRTTCQPQAARHQRVEPLRLHGGMVAVDGSRGVLQDEPR